MKLIAILLYLFAVLTFAQETGARYLIITHDNYVNALRPLTQWKTRKGLKAKIVPLSETGSDSISIKNYITNAYNTWQIKPEYLLLVGNGYQIPFPVFDDLDYAKCDNYYTNVVGDFHNEIIPGRLWVFDTFEVKTIVAKVLGYEKTPYLLDSLWFRKGVTIVNEDPYPPYSDSVYWADARFAHQLMNDAGFVHIDSFAMSFGDSSPDVINAINDGRTYVLYRGLGGGAWGPPFYSIDPQDMLNGFKLPIVISGTCLTIEGIGYWWLNAGTPEEPRGTVGFFGTTTALGAAAELRSALANGTLQSIFCDSFATLGKAAEAGRLNYYALFGNTLEYNSWTCLGDPEMTVWTAFPRSLQVTYTQDLHVGVCTVSVHVQHDFAPVESALVCLAAKEDLSVYNYGRTDNLGNIQFIDTFQIILDSIYLTVTGRNLLPYTSAIKEVFTGGPYVEVISFSISDSLYGNNDSVVNPGENIEIPLWVKNYGDSTAYDVSGVIRSVEPDFYITWTDTLKYFGDVQPQDSAFTSADGYNLVVANNCPDMHETELRLAVSDAGGATWNSFFCFTVHAPILLFNDYYFLEGGLSLPPGDTNQLIIVLENIGSYKAENTIGTVSTTDSFVTPVDSVSFLGTILPDSLGSNQADPFMITAAPQTPLWHPLHMRLIITSGVYADTFSMMIVVGRNDYLVWDADLNHTSGPVIKSKLDSLGFSGDYKTTFPNDSLSLYRSLFACVGIYPNNYVIRDTSNVGFEIQHYLASEGGKVYLEGGDVWWGDPHSNHGYDFCPLFKINPISNTIGAFPGVVGISGTFTQNMSFRYQGEVTMIDYIDSINGSASIFRSSNYNRGCGVAADHRTIGLSYEFSGLVDTVLPSTKLILMDSIMRYFGITTTGVEENQDMLRASAYMTMVVMPNPSVSAVRITCHLSPKEYDRGYPMLRIFDISGRMVKMFPIPRSPDTEHSLIGAEIVWHADDNYGRIVPTGVYFAELKTKTNTLVKKLILIK